MSNRVLIVILIMNFCLPSISLAVESGNELNDNCKVAGNFLDGQKEFSKSEYTKIGLCMGYMNGFSEAVILKEVNAQSEKLYCIPDGVIVSQRIKIVNKYIDDNPDKLHLPAAMLVVYAFQQAFPCK